MYLRSISAAVLRLRFLAGPARQAATAAAILSASSWDSVSSGCFRLTLAASPTAEAEAGDAGTVALAGVDAVGVWGGVVVGDARPGAKSSIGEASGGTGAPEAVPSAAEGAPTDTGAVVDGASECSPATATLAPTKALAGLEPLGLVLGAVAAPDD